MKNIPCQCRSYGFPHKPGGGKCEHDGDGDEELATCRDCGSTDLEIESDPYSFPQDVLVCKKCGSGDIAESLTNWSSDWTAEKVRARRAGLI
jgi:hypothetical protein